MLICFALRHTASEAVEVEALLRFNLSCVCSVKTFPYQPATCCDLQPLLRSLHACKRRRLLQYAPPRLLLEPAAGLVRRSHTFFVGAPDYRQRLHKRCTDPRCACLALGAACLLAWCADCQRMVRTRLYIIAYRPLV